jgi:hypothetical protein
MISKLVHAILNIDIDIKPMTFRIICFSIFVMGAFAFIILNLIPLVDKMPYLTYVPLTQATENHSLLTTYHDSLATKATIRGASKYSADNKQFQTPAKLITTGDSISIMSSAQLNSTTDTVHVVRVEYLPNKFFNMYKREWRLPNDLPKSPEEPQQIRGENADNHQSRNKN